MRDQSIPLFQVLIEEYNHQRPASGQYTDHLAGIQRHSLADSNEDECKRINSEELRKFYKWLHDSGDRRSAICFSGGGIRSATFGLGILQGLARRELIDKFDFLSTVSGGGYLGSWLSAWIHRKGIAKVQERLKTEYPTSPLVPEPGPVAHLRSYSNYLTPRLGLLSADTWTLVAIFLRNLLLNWLILIPLILLALMVPRFCVLLVAYPIWSLIQIAPASLTDLLTWLSPNGSDGALWLALTFGVIAIGYVHDSLPSHADADLRDSSDMVNRFKDQNRLKTQAWFLRICLTPLILLALFATTYYGWMHVDVNKADIWQYFVVFGLILNGGGLLVSLPFRKSFHWTLPAEFGVALGAGGFGGFLTWLVAAKVFPNPSASVETVAAYVCFAVPVFMTLFLLSATLFVGLSSTRMSDADREWAARTGAWVMIASLVWIVVSVIVVYGPLLLLYGARTAIASISLGTLSGGVTLLLGRSEKTSADTKSAIAPMDRALMFAAPVFAAFILICLSYLISWLAVVLGQFGSAPDLATFEGTLKVLLASPFMLLFRMFGILLVVAVLSSWFVNINKFSLNAAYRDRLIRAYLGASRIEKERTPNPFTGLDEHDNLQMQQLRTQLFHEDNVRNLTVLIQRLQNVESVPPWRPWRRGQPEQPADPVSSYLWKHLSEKTKVMIENFQPEAEVQNAFRYALFDDLNRLIQGQSIFHEDRFKRSELPKRILDLIDQKPLVETLRLNRELLEFAYPDVFKPVLDCKPLHVVNMTLNLVGGKKLAWQNRRAESFTASALHSGSYCLGYRDSNKYALNRENVAITLGTAAAISGAAVSPNMGNYSSAFVTFLLTLFNLRMGWWLGNPGRAGSSGRRTTYDQPGPILAARPLIAETLGLTDDEHPYVYLSDGGHFENLGLYEMVLRRCKMIVISDGSADPGFGLEGLGVAVGKIRVDLGVPIRISEVFMLPRDADEDSRRYGEINPRFPRKYCAIGRVCYSRVDGSKDADPDKYDGYLIYVKAFLSGTEAVDVYNYARTHKTFPHESTADQWFTEGQFESYRELGSHMVDQICDGLPADANTLEHFFDFVKTRLAAMKSDDDGATSWS